MCIRDRYERKEKVKRGKDEEVNGQGGKRGAPAPHGTGTVEDMRVSDDDDNNEANLVFAASISSVLMSS